MAANSRPSQCLWMKQSSRGWNGRSEERRVGKERRYWRDWSSDVCSSDLHFVPDVLYEVSLVERLAVESSGFETDLVDVLILPDRVIIKSKLLVEDGGEQPAVAVPLDEAKLALLEWEIGRASCREREEILA